MGKITDTIKDAIQDTTEGYVRDRTIEATKAILEEVNWTKVAEKALAVGKQVAKGVKERAQSLTGKPSPTKKLPAVQVKPRVVRTVKR